ncbi:unnamed protein product [Triticum turgidum subsp. durum]|uniref:Sulfotransferase n=1 Tax=Triticum turgidum subsp. durum TaxID=4567 RepID=A0A9R0QIP9_TRITD|nr:unnamed protein product [Triticum turgidum subsp. durum]
MEREKLQVTRQQEQASTAPTKTRQVMAAAALEKGTACAVGPVPFKDVGGDGEEDQKLISPPEEYTNIISALPSTTWLDQRVLRQYQGSWLHHQMVPGVISVQRRFTARPDDVLLVSPPKCGTTWLKALSFATMARAAYPPSGTDHPLLRLNPHDCVPFVEVLFSAGQEARLEALPSPRLLHTHMHHSLLPPSLARCKIVYVCREPKDMVVSIWHFAKSIMPAGGIAFSFSDLYESACQGKHLHGPIWDHVLGYWSASKASPERVLFLRYEEMLLNPVSTVRNLARFLGMPFTAAEEAAGTPIHIAELCSIDTMRGLETNNTGAAGVLAKFPHGSFFRKGVVGDWVNHMTPEMARRINAIVEDKLRGSGLSFTP